MLRKIASTIGQVVESVVGVVGIRVGTEEPPHSSRRLTDAVEIRRYEPRIAAQTTVDTDEERHGRRVSVASLGTSSEGIGGNRRSR